MNKIEMQTLQVMQNLIAVGLIHWVRNIHAKYMKNIQNEEIHFIIDETKLHKKFVALMK